MKKLSITLFAIVSALCLMFGVFSMSNVKLASAENVAGATPVLSETKVNISKNNDKMLLVTAIKNKADVYEVGYTFTGEVTTINAVSDKYYTSISNDTDTVTASDLFGSEWAGEDVGMIIWEINFALGNSYEYKAYAKVGARNGSGNLVLPDSEVVVTPVNPISKTFYTVAFDTDGGTAIETELVLAGTSASELANFVPEKVGYDFVKWQLNGQDIPSGATVQQNIMVKAVWAEKTYNAVFMADGEEVETKTYTHFNMNVEEPDVPFKAGYEGAWEEYELVAGGVTVNAVYTEVDYNDYSTYTVSADLDMRDEAFNVSIPEELSEYEVLSSKLTSYGDGTLNAGVTKNNDGTVNIPKGIPNQGENTICVRMIKDRTYATLNMEIIKAKAIISTRSDLRDTLFTDLNNGATKNSWYILGADVDWTDPDTGTAPLWAPGQNNTPKDFEGVLDGRGYTLANYYSQFGLCRINSGTIKNVHLKPIIRTNTSKVSGVALRNNGTIENCFVDIAITDAEKAVIVSGIVANNEETQNNGVVSNCVVMISRFVSTTNASYIGDVTMSAIANTSGTADITNCYAINKIASEQYLHVNDMDGKNNTDGLYDNADTFFDDVTELSSANGWNSYWKIENNALYFNNVKVLEKTA